MAQPRGIRRWRRPSIAIATVAAVLVAGAAGATTSTVATAKRTVPSPTVTGPVTGGVKGFPFTPSPVPLASYGYLEQEFFIRGIARAYDLSPDAIASTGRTAPAVAPYITRIVVRRPTDPARFNGRVVVDWLNVTSGYDVDAGFGELWREIVRDGYAYVGVTTQVVGVAGLKAFDPVRYATLAIPGDQFSYDIYSQAVQALRQPIGVRPLGPLQVRRVYAYGDSQSGSTLNNYVNNVYPKVRRVIDGFLITTSTTALPQLSVPVLRVVTEFEVDNEPHQAATPFFRQWEVAGGGHTDIGDSQYLVPEEDREWGMPPGRNWPLAPTATVAGCLLDRMAKWPAEQAALVALDRWVTVGVAPSVTAPITVTGGAIARDSLGNALGGLRLPGEQVPTGANYGESSNECQFTLGKTVPFDAAGLHRLYPTHADYVAKVQAAVAQDIVAGYLLPADGTAIIATAQASNVGK
jgi:hypothetical protein